MNLNVKLGLWLCNIAVHVAAAVFFFASEWKNIGQRRKWELCYIRNGWQKPVSFSNICIKWIECSITRKNRGNDESEDWRKWLDWNKENFAIAWIYRRKPRSKKKEHRSKEKQPKEREREKWREAFGYDETKPAQRIYHKRNEKCAQIMQNSIIIIILI